MSDERVGGGRFDFCWNVSEFFRGTRLIHTVKKTKVAYGHRGLLFRRRWTRRREKKDERICEAEFAGGKEKGEGDHGSDEKRNVSSAVKIIIRATVGCGTGRKRKTSDKSVGSIFRANRFKRAYCAVMRRRRRKTRLSDWTQYDLSIRKRSRSTEPF